MSVQAVARKPKKSGPPRNVGEVLDRLAFVNERLVAVRRVIGNRATQQMVSAVIDELTAIRDALPDIAVGGVKKQDIRREGGERRERSPSWRAKNRSNPVTGIEERFCPRHHAGHGAWVPTECFDVKNPIKGTLRYCCRDCWRDYQRERYVAANKKAIIIEVIDGDKIIGAYCNGCGAPFEVGDLVVGVELRHRDCKPNGPEMSRVTS